MNRAGVFLLALGLAQMTADVAGWSAWRGIAAATGASPAPRVFSVARGLETFSTRFFIDWTDSAGDRHSEMLTSERYARLRGPYNRRNIYGAALAYGPVLAAAPGTRPLFEAVASYGLCGERPLLRELGIDPATVAGAPLLRYIPRPGSDTGDLPLRLEVTCR